MGRPKSPASIKMLHGTYREDRDGGGLSVPSGAPEKPGWLSERASGTWDQTVEMLSAVPGLLATLDSPSLAAYCQAWELFHKARNDIEANGIVAVGAKGGKIQNPAVVTMQKAIDTIHRFCSKFGMTPGDRASMKLPEKKSQGVVTRRRA